MALNAVRFLGEIAHSSNLTLEQIKHGLSYSPVGDCLESTDWARLYHAENIGEIRDIASELLPAYQKTWEVLGKPETAEAWKQAQYGSRP